MSSLRRVIRETTRARQLLVGTMCVLTCATASRVADAQTLSQQTRVMSNGESPAHLISVNPFLPLFGYFQGEYEQRIAPAVSFAFAGSHVKPSDVRYTNMDAKIRLYPSERALNGFNMAASLGVARIQNTKPEVCAIVGSIDPLCGESGAAFTAGAFAIEAGQQWMMGPSQSVAVTVGGGFKRYLGDRDNFRGINRIMPTLRLSVGYAF